MLDPVYRDAVLPFGPSPMAARVPKMKTRFAYLTLLLGIVFAMGQPAQADSLWLHVPFEFKAAGRLMPSGDYTMEAAGSLLRMRSAARGVSVVTIAILDDSQPETGKPCASFEITGDMPTLSLVNLSNGVVLRLLLLERPAVHVAPGTVLLSRH
jgi:hypothetical protein